jgi:hypothetical protein
MSDDLSDEGLYRILTVDQLEAMRRAFALDLAHGADEDFCTSRIALIDRLLAQRSE